MSINLREATLIAHDFCFDVRLHHPSKIIYITHLRGIKWWNEQVVCLVISDMSTNSCSFKSPKSEEQCHSAVTLRQKVKKPHVHICSVTCLHFCLPAEIGIVILTLSQWTATYQCITTPSPSMLGKYYESLNPVLKNSSWIRY